VHYADGAVSRVDCLAVEAKLSSTALSQADCMALDAMCCIHTAVLKYAVAVEAKLSSTALSQADCMALVGVGCHVLHTHSCTTVRSGSL